MNIRFAIVVLLGTMPAFAWADVVKVCLEPPMRVFVPWTDEPDPLVESIDFNQDGQPDLTFTYDRMYMTAHFFSPGQIFIVPDSAPGQKTYGGAAAIPFGTSIGSNIVSSLISKYDTWLKGYPDPGDPIGDSANDVGYVASDDTEGDPPVIHADEVGKEGVMGFMLYWNGQPHFAYVHFDFRYNNTNGIVPGLGFGGNIIGYAYETQPGVPIVAERLNDSTPSSDGLITGFQSVNGYQLTWDAVSGATYRMQTSTNLATWTDAGGDLVADQNSITVTVAPSPTGQCFYRVRRTK